jgi:leucyl aminopeptidase
MTLLTSQTSPRDVQADAIVIGVVQGPGGALPAPGADDVDQALDGGLAATLSVLGATGRAEEITKIATAGRLTAPLIVAVGIGPVSGGAPPDGEALRRAAGAAVRALAAVKPRQVALALPARNDAEAEAVGLGALLGGYVFSRYRANGHQPATELTILGSASAAAVRRARTLADAVMLVRDLVNTGPSHLFPSAFAAEAERIASASGLDIEVLDEQELADGGYGGITGVGQGSVRPPRLVRLAYSPPGATKTVVFAGKGITFDSGGLSLKPPKAMETMKSDMGGAAAVLAAMQALAALGPVVNVVGYMPLAENMPSGTAQRPSDVITIFGGTTVEVLNTDAEGRLVLADALARSEADSPDLLVDVATLTGAQLVALGPRISGARAWTRRSPTLPT